jgi:clan AA aspartic protease (TIGR02281 family)
MLKIVCAAATAAAAACLITLPNQMPQTKPSSSIRAAKSGRTDAAYARTCSHDFSAASSDAKSRFGSSDARPNCKGHYLPSGGRVSPVGAAGVHVLPVTINGVSGHFVLDTGAAYVSITSELAAKARVVKHGSQLLKTVGGTVRADVAYADSIAVGRAKAEDVIVSVISSESDPFPAHTDGLLGMSFLDRFKIDVSQNGLVLTPITGRELF